MFRWYFGLCWITQFKYNGFKKINGWRSFIIYRKKGIWGIFEVYNIFLYNFRKCNIELNETDFMLLVDHFDVEGDGRISVNDVGMVIDKAS